MYNVKGRSDTQNGTKSAHPESVSEMLQTVGILTDHIATSQLATRKSQVTSFYMSQKNTKKNDLRGNCLIVCYLLHIIHLQSIFLIFLIIFLNSDIDLLDLTKIR